MKRPLPIKLYSCTHQHAFSIQKHVRAYLCRYPHAASRLLQRNLTVSEMLMTQVADATNPNNLGQHNPSCLGHYFL